MFNKTENSGSSTRKTEKKSTFFQKINFKTLDYYRILTVIGLILFLFPVWVQAGTVYKTGFEPDEFTTSLKRTGFSLQAVKGRGQVLTIEVKKQIEVGAKKADGNAGSCAISQEFPPGWYLLKADYKTEGFKPRGDYIFQFIGAKDPFQCFPAASEWSVLKTYFFVPKKGKIRYYICRAKGAEQGAKIFIDNLSIAPYTIPEGVNILGNPDFSKGKTGELPALWHWRHHKGEKGDYALVKDKTFRIGNRVMCITSNDKTRVLTSAAMPLPQKGKITFSCWAKGKGESNIYILSRKHKLFMRKKFLLSDKWKKYEITTDCKPLGEGKFFHVRFNLNNSGKMYIAGASVIYSKKDDKKVIKGHPIVNTAQCHSHLFYISIF